MTQFKSEQVLRYSDEQLMNRAMPCPVRYAKPRKFCKREPNKNGIIKNHKERQILFNEFIKSSNEVGGIHLHGRELHLTTKWAKKYYDKETEKIDGN